jgi:HNH endonuclease
MVSVAQLRNGKTKSCGCLKHEPLRDAVDRFWDKVEKTPTCWIWTGGTARFGHGLRREDKHLRFAVASRFSWELHFGPVPDGLCVLHHCDNPPCVRPDHLFLGTKADNTADMMAKGRHRHG